MSGLIVSRTFSKRPTCCKSSYLQSQQITTTVKNQSNRPRRLDRRKGVAVSTLLDATHQVPSEENSSSSVTREAGTDGPLHRGLRKQRVLDVSGTSRAYQESATAKYRQELHRAQQIARLRESGSFVASTSAAARHRQKRAENSEEGRKSLKTNPSSLTIPVSAEELEDLVLARINEVDSRHSSTNKETPMPKKAYNWGPTLMIGGLAGSSMLLFLASGMLN